MRNLQLVSSEGVLEESACAAAGQGIRVLVIAADVFLRKRTARELVKSGFTVHERDDVDSARTALARGQYDVVVADRAVDAPVVVELGADVVEACEVLDVVLERLWEQH